MRWTAREIRVRYQGSALGVLWHLANPIAVCAIFGFVFTRVFGADGGQLPYLTAAWAGLVCWTPVQSTMQYGAMSFVFAAGTVTKVMFPRAVVPLAAAGASIVDLGVGFAILLGVALIQGVGLQATLVWAPLVFSVLMVWVCAAAVLLATLTVFVRDVATAVTIAVRLGFIATPVMYVAASVPDRYRYLLDINPIAVVIDSLRALLENTEVDWALLAVHGTLGSLMLLASLTYLRAVDGRLADAL